MQSHASEQDLLDELKNVKERQSVDQKSHGAHEEHDFGELFVHQII